MKVLGIHYGHNATVCLIENGTITFCQSEERLNRIKNSTGFPFLTLDYIYNHIAPPEAIDLAVVFQKTIYGYLHLKKHGFKSFQYGYYLRDATLNGKSLKERLKQTDLGWSLGLIKIAATENDKSLQKEAHRYFTRSLKLPPEKVQYLDHHLAHAYSALLNTQDWGRALIFTLDGVGDWKCATVNLYENGKLTALSTTDHRNSLGYYYSGTTAILGMKAEEHEFKVMGLAPYAKPTYYKPITDELRKLLTIDADGNWVSRPTLNQLMPELERVYRFQRFDNIAGAIQELTEELIARWVRFWVEKTGCRNVAVAGGVFMNVKACQKMAEMDTVDKLFVVPSAADETTAVGCAVRGSMALAPQTPVQPLRDLYLGMDFDDAKIEKAMAEMNAGERYDVSRPENINCKIGHLLAENKIVARCSGRMEFGARALGNRSILANPSDRKNVQLINDAVKSRDFWMPFTPSILEDDMPRYVQNHERIFAPYMCITFNSTPEARRDLPAALHPKDFTVRPQCVRKDWNSDYYEIIRAFKDQTGIGGVLNTSFNLHGEPNVCSPVDAIRTVDNSGLAYLAMGSYLLAKRDNQP
ncbi:MAG: hypothetical protein HYZ49_00715 [Chloroflexi bacterium]|nr:hypothetical protein [Chloroflexota bacterium]